MTFCNYGLRKVASFNFVYAASCLHMPKPPRLASIEGHPTIYFLAHIGVHTLACGGQGNKSRRALLAMWLGALLQRASMFLTRSLSARRLYVGRHKASLKYIQSLCCSGGWERCSIKMSLQQGYLHPLACIPLTLSSPMPGQHNGGLLYSQCGPFLPFPARSGPNPGGVLLLCFSELGSNCLKWAGLVKHLLCRTGVFGCAWFMLKAVVLSREDAQRRIRGAGSTSLPNVTPNNNGGERQR